MTPKFPLTQPLIFRSLQPIYPSLTNAFEYWLMKNTSYPTCFLRYTNECVVLGANQLAFAECNLKQMENDNIKLIRRKSGGAVYLDSGNCLFGIVGNKIDVTQNIFSNILTKSINTTFDVDAIPTGKNDISININLLDIPKEELVDYLSLKNPPIIIQKKVAGLAYNIDKDCMLCHACIMINCNSHKFPLYLTPNQKKLKSHHIKSMDKRTVNLAQFNISKTRTHLENQLIKTFADTYMDGNYTDKIIDIYSEDMLSIPDVKKIYDEQTSNDFVYGKNLKYNKRISKKFS
jgi:lipoate-protein ligase A